ncbi:MAG: hypothetical protein Q619_VDC00292G0001, partial [Veillonella dispar DORA_11]
KEKFNIPNRSKPLRFKAILLKVLKQAL